MTDLTQALRDEADLMRTELFGRTPFDPAFVIAAMLDRIAERVEGEDVTAKWLAEWEPYFAEEDRKQLEEIRRYDR